MNEARRMVSPEQVARRTGLSRRAVYRAIAEGELPASRLRARLRVREIDVDRWIETNLVEPRHQSVPRPRPAALPAENGLCRLLPQLDRRDVRAGEH